MHLVSAPASHNLMRRLIRLPVALDATAEPLWKSRSQHVDREWHCRHRKDPEVFQEMQTFLRALPKGPLTELSSHKKKLQFMFSRHFDCTLLWILPYIFSVQCQCAASIMDKKSNVQPCKHTEDPHCCSLWYYSAFSFVLGFSFIHFFFLNNFNFTALVHSCAAIWQRQQQQQVAVYTSGHAA